MDLKRLLMNLNRLETQPMDDFLHGVKNIADSLAAIQFAISDINLSQYTLDALDSNYDGFVDALTHMPGMLTFDYVRNKLLVHEHQVQCLKRRSNGSLTHLAFVSTIVSSHDAGFNFQPFNFNLAMGRTTRIIVGRTITISVARTPSPSTPQTTSTTRVMPICSVLCNSPVPLSHIQCTSASITNSLSTGNETFEAVLGSAPFIICQIRHSPAHNATIGSICYQASQSPTLPTMATFTLLSLVRPCGTQTLPPRAL